jgi:signal transduction histidine kinase
MESVENLNYFIGDAPFGLIVCNKKGLITMINSQAMELLSIPGSPGEINGREITSAVSKLPEVQNAVHNMITARTQTSFVDSVLFKYRKLLIRGKAGKIGYFLTIQNITPEVDDEQVNISAILQGLEQERERVAREIHDGINPMLASIRLNMEAIMARNKSSLDKQTIQEWKRLVDSLDETMKDLRNISHQLLPSVISDFGLAQAITSLCALVEGMGEMKTNFYSNLKKRLDPDYELSLYRIVQEFANNAIKHSGADDFSVQLVDHPESLLLIVEDNGKGWDMNNPEIIMKGIGLRNIKGRVTALNGTIVFDTQPGKGLCAILEFPHNP